VSGPGVGRPRSRRPGGRPVRLVAGIVTASLLGLSAAVAGAGLGLSAAVAEAAEDGSAVTPRIRGAVVLEPGRIRAGDVAVLEVVVATPPEHVLRPVRMPAAVPGLRVLDRTRLPVRREDGRWVHRVRIRVRAREVGQLAWPAQRVEVETADGSVTGLELEGRPIEVASVLPDHPGRSAPFGLREPTLGATGPGAWTGAVAGSLATLAALAAVALWRRRRRARAVGPSRAPAAAPPDPAQALERARRALAEDAPAAARALAIALRAGLARHLGRDALSGSVPELRSRLAEAGASAEARAVVALLERVEALRFAPPAQPEPGPVRPLLAEAGRLLGAAEPVDG